MTEQELFINIGYLANPMRHTIIEIELPLTQRQRFENKYAQLTRNYPLPINSGARPYYIWPPGTNKWGIETRAYFISNENLPESLFDVLEPRKILNRPGYEIWKRRISRKKIIYKLFEFGFIIGNEQFEERIRSFIPSAYIQDFNHGFRL